MTDDARLERNRSGLMMPLALSVVLLILYLLSPGPTALLAVHGIVDWNTYVAVVTVVYYPLIYVSEETDFFEDHSIGQAYMQYIDWFGK